MMHLLAGSCDRLSLFCILLRSVCEFGSLFVRQDGYYDDLGAGSYVSCCAIRTFLLRLLVFVRPKHP